MNGKIGAVSQRFEVGNREQRETVQQRIPGSNRQAELAVVVRSLVRADVPFVGACETDPRLVHDGWAERSSVRQSGERLVVANRLTEQTCVAALVGVGGTVVALQITE